MGWTSKPPVQEIHRFQQYGWKIAWDLGWKEHPIALFPMTDPYVCNIWCHIYHQQKPQFFVSIHHTYGSVMGYYPTIIPLLLPHYITTYGTSKLDMLRLHPQSWRPRKLRRLNRKTCAMAWPRCPMNSWKSKGSPQEMHGEKGIIGGNIPKKYSKYIGINIPIWISSGILNVSIFPWIQKSMIDTVSVDQEFEGNIWLCESSFTDDDRS